MTSQAAIGMFHPLHWHCKKSNNKDIGALVDGRDALKIPAWCPLRPEHASSPASAERGDLDSEEHF